MPGLSRTRTVHSHTHAHVPALKTFEGAEPVRGCPCVPRSPHAQCVASSTRACECACMRVCTRARACMRVRVCRRRICARARVYGPRARICVCVRALARTRIRACPCARRLVRRVRFSQQQPVPAVLYYTMHVGRCMLHTVTRNSPPVRSAMRHLVQSCASVPARSPTGTAACTALVCLQRQHWAPTPAGCNS